ncbi:hypothetical protein AVEN_55501-1 [Araneus ventricosus]|uniref:Uncharacterized protein n=1 Tax=Araneus ventricosus TaxID=182803 RepID=A0A4Y2CCD0_ARAVE|nr:hypothetical protein AVEN_55501-1 [Araneus ventricosus]
MGSCSPKAETFLLDRTDSEPRSSDEDSLSKRSSYSRRQTSAPQKQEDNLMHERSSSGLMARFRFQDWRIAGSRLLPRQIRRMNGLGSG